MTPAQKALFDETISLASESELNFKEASIALGAEPRHYVRVREIPGSLRLHLFNWHRLRKIQTLRRLLNQEPAVTNDHPVVLKLERVFTKLEFGMLFGSPEERYRLRTNVLRRNVQLWDLHAAYRSLAVKKTTTAITYREFRAQQLRLFSWAKDLSIGAILALYLLVFYSAKAEGCITCYQLGWAFLAHYIIAATVIAWWLVRDSTKASAVLKSLGCIPSQ